jgi:hypothetical protein
MPRDHFARPAIAPSVERARLAQARELLSGDALADYTVVQRQTAALNAFVVTLPREHSFRDSQLGVGLHAAVHAIEHNFARFINVGARILWFDSHTDNLHIQSERIAPALTDIALFLDELQTRRNAFGPLIEQTTVLIGSELGRYPKLNVAHGKDHWPENSWILAGRGVRRAPGGVELGATDRRFRGQEVDFDTGQIGGDAKRPLFIDSIFATLLQLAGGDPRQHGYGRDAVLRCLLA